MRGLKRVERVTYAPRTRCCEGLWVEEADTVAKAVVLHSGEKSVEYHSGEASLIYVCTRSAVVT